MDTISNTSFDYQHCFSLISLTIVVLLAKVSHPLESVIKLWTSKKFGGYYYCWSYFTTEGIIAVTAVEKINFRPALNLALG